MPVSEEQHGPLGSLLRDPRALPLRPPGTLDAFGPTLVVAPHPDDESLGCGGLLATLQRRGVPAGVVFVSDGTGSHPNSRSHPPGRLRMLRESEAQEALRRLGLPRSAATFLRLPDRFVPHPGQDGFAKAAARCRDVLRRHTAKPESPRWQTVVVPWRRDPHGDHRAAWHLFRAAADEVGGALRWVEYPVWAWEADHVSDHPQRGEVAGWRLDVTAVREAKRAAIAAHRSQLTDLITDDPSAFRLDPDVLRHFDHPWETYFEER